MESILPSLAIRLASHLADPHGMARQARIFYHQMIAHAMASLPTAVDRQGQEHDFRRYATAYQAAVLYHVATKSAHEQNTHTRKDEESAVRPLKLDDLVKACADCTYSDIKEKIACVDKWAQEMQPKQGTKPKAFSSSSNISPASGARRNGANLRDRSAD